jgi:hypothetical protein
VADSAKTADATMIRRRHVIYVEGYDPQGAEGYYSLFERSWKRFLKIWPVKGNLSPLALDSPDFAHWDVAASGPDWQVATRYDFLRQEHIIRANMAEPLPRLVSRALGWTADYLMSGALVQVLRASWEFGLALIHFQMLMLWWVVLSVGGGWLVALAAKHYVGFGELMGAIIAVIAAVAIFFALRPLAKRWFVIQINSHWPYLCEFARGEATCFDAPIEACAQRGVDAARANEVDEIVVVGHSGGGALAPAVITRALEIDPDVGRRGPPLVLLTLGSIAPGAALHPKANKLRDVFARLAREPSITWIDAQSRKDVLNFWDFDPIAGLGITLDTEHYPEKLHDFSDRIMRPNKDNQRVNPIVWKVRFRDMLSLELYKRIRFDFFRLHYQFIMANDQRAPYDYFMLVAGPVPVVAWAKDPRAVLARFADDGRLLEDVVAGGRVGKGAS